jgi:4-hydroxy-3-polyprenylbenzoate decarboxylase
VAGPGAAVIRWRSAVRPPGVPRLAYGDLGAFLAALERAGELRRVPVEVDPELEVAEIVDRLCKSGGPAVLFESVRGSPHPLACNLFGSDRRMAMAFGAEDLEQVAARLRGLAGLVRRRPSGPLGLLGLLPDLRPLLAMPPRRARGPAPVQEVIQRGEEVDLRTLPMLRCWPGDGGRYLTLPAVITEDPETGARNVGCYRLQLHGPRALGLHWERHKGGAGHYARARAAGRPIEVAVVLGGDPAEIYAAGAPLPDGFDEYAFAGFLRGSPVELCRAVSVSLDVPARAEVVIEGVVDPDELLPEGPFGDHTGFYDPGGPYPVLRVTAVTRRARPVVPASLAGRPPMEDHWLLGRTSERLFLPLIQLLLPEVVDLHAPPEGAANNLLFVSVRKRYPGHAYQAAYGLLGLGLLGLTKVVVAVDDWVDVHRPGEAWWAALANCDPARDVLVLRGPGSVLDFALRGFSVGGKLVLDGTRKWPEECGAEGPRGRWPEPAVMAPEVVAAVTRRWAEYGLGADPGPTAARAPGPPPGWSGEPGS